jgi:hypothetical protein
VRLPLRALLCAVSLLGGAAPAAAACCPAHYLGTPEWLPDGSGLLVDYGGASIVNLAGGRRVVLPDARNPSLSPSGSQIAAIGIAGSDHEGRLEVARADRTGERVFGPAYSGPAWSAGSSELVYVGEGTRFTCWTSRRARTGRCQVGCIPATCQSRGRPTVGVSP